jgi:hypothetical protein
MTFHGQLHVPYPSVGSLCAYAIVGMSPHQPCVLSLLLPAEALLVSILILQHTGTT